MKHHSLAALGLFLVCLGCSSQRSPAPPTNTKGVVVAAPDAPAAHELAAFADPAQAKRAGEVQAKGGKGDAGEDVETPRKIKYTADIKVICEDFPKAEESLKAALKKHKAIVAHSEVSGSPGAPRGGLWRVRVPVAHFDDFREAVLKLGEPEKNTSDSEDVTDEYYDLENHIKNKLAEEESLRKLLEKSGDSLQNILTLREKLAQIRDYINRQEGKLKVLANLTDLTTVTVAVREKQKYDSSLPPAIAETPTFGMRVERTFTGTWDAFVGFIQLVVLAVIAVAPWAGLAICVSIPVLLVMRRWNRSLPVIGEVVQPVPPPSA